MFYRILPYAYYLLKIFLLLLLLVDVRHCNTSPFEQLSKQRRIVPYNVQKYYEFDNGKWTVKDCTYVLGQQMQFEIDPKNTFGGSCKPQNRTHKIRRKREGNTVDYPCFENTDCVGNGMFCSSTKRCACLSTFVDIGGTCWQRINPDEAGCVYNRQCSAVWPGAFCSGGTCKCANSQPAFPTRDGPICLNYGNCPVNGDAPRYRPDGQAVQCNDDSQCPLGYDCICSTPGCGLETGSTNTPFCCPSRAMACIQGLDEGVIPPGGNGGGVTRYYYNAITGGCATFTFRGSGGNANNFESKEHCESYCMQSCSRGRPEYTVNTNPGLVYKEVIHDCSSSSTQNSGCFNNDYECQRIGTSSLCCPTRKVVCGNKGGFPTGPTLSGPDVGFSPMAGGSQTYSRYYYDSNSQRCFPFQYKGQGGNFNNFLSREHCEQYCASTLCAAGEPLKDLSGIKNIGCKTTNVCPATHECSTDGVCCPKKQTVCSMKMSIGTCANYVERWWFNAATRNCELFTYSGCQGNANNFESYIECQSFCRDATVEPKCPQGKAAKDSFLGTFVICGGAQSTTSCPANYDCYFDGTVYGCCPTKSYSCSLPSDQGTQCGPSVTRWYYNPSKRSCQTFEYFGCDGNSNNHATQQDCIDYCGVGGCPEGGEPFRESSGAYRVCSGGTVCPYTHFCTQVTLGTSTVYNYCCPTRSFVCSLPKDQGQRCSSTTLMRYYFNIDSRNCEEFTYNGCGGSRNNFAAMSQCLNYCNSAGCPAGTIALTDRDSNTLTSCSVGQLGSCPTGYVCTFSTLLNQNICCGAPGSGDKCQAGQTTYIDALTSSPMQCTPNVPGNCPSGYVCWYSVASNAYYCCGNAATQCAQGGNVYINQATNTPQQCTPGVTGACPTSYTCQATSLSISGVPSTTGYCCGSSGMCPNNGQVQIVNNIPVPCQTSGLNVCTAPYTCQYSSVMNQHYCCTQGVLQSAPVCGSQLPYIVNFAPVVCSSGSTSTNCPSPYSCQLYAATNTFYCCQTAQVQTPPVPTISAASSCPPGLAPLQTGGGYQYCSPNAQNACPPGYYCQYDTNSFRYICCGQPGQTSVSATVGCGCPNQAACFPSGGQQQCMPGSSLTCAPGYACQYSSMNSRYQCCQSGSTTFGSGFVHSAVQQPFQTSSDAYGCSQGKSYLYPNTSIPLACQPAGSSCPVGYSCLKSIRYRGHQCCSDTFHSAAPASSASALVSIKHQGHTVSSSSGNIRLGDSGCFADSQCHGDLGARCKNGVCLCASNQLVFNGRCVRGCPGGFMNIGGICSPTSPRGFLRQTFFDDSVDRGRSNTVITRNCTSKAVQSQSQKKQHTSSNQPPDDDCDD